MTLWFSRRLLHGETQCGNVPYWQQVIHSLLYTWNCVFHPVLILMYWNYLNTSFYTTFDPASKAVIVSMHGVELVIILAEIIFGAMNINWVAFAPVLLLLGLYAIWMWIFYWSYVASLITLNNEYLR
jgi:hypothetical protein